MPRRLIAIVVTSILIGAACSGGETDQATSAPTELSDASAVDSVAGGGEAGPPTAGTDIPAVDVIDVRTGETVSLQSFATGETPILFWFWAPH